MQLTIGMATFRDNDLLWATLTRLRDAMAASRLADRIELLVVDNEPGGPHGKLNESLCRSMKARYIPFPAPVGTGPPRNEVVRQAAGEWVLCMDSHVFLCEGVLPRLVAWTENNPSIDLHHGVLMQSRLVNDDGSPAINWTHWVPRWGEDGMFGKSAKNPAAVDPELPPFLIPHSGMGLFLTRKDAWLGFHPQQRHFGTEGYVPIKYYQHGRKVWCLPWLRWVHHFRDKTVAAPFPTDWRSRAANYLHFWKELAPCIIRFEDIKKAHLQAGRVSQKTWNELLAEIGIDPAEAARRDNPRPVVPVVSLTGGPGTELKGLLASLGITPDERCDCNERVLEMDVWGVAGCRENKDKIVKWLHDGQARWGWSQRILAGVHAVGNGLAFRLNPLAPLESLVDEAIRRAEAAEQKRAGV